MKRAEKYQETQMHLVGEWAKGSSTGHGADVFCPKTGRVSKQYLSACKEKRALTQDLMERVCSLLNLGDAMHQVVKNGGSPGIDRMPTSELKKWLEKNQKVLIKELKGGNYKPELVKTVEIPKPNGGNRQLGIPTVRDRLVQQAIGQVLAKQYELSFSSNSYGFRKGRGAGKALSQAGKYVADGYNHIVDLDLEKFFDEVNHDRLMWLLSRRIGDRNLLNLIGRFLRSGIMKGGMRGQKVKGTPQGSPLSPILSNIVLDELDKELERRGHKFVRYADDIIILVRSEQASKRVKESITSYIERRLRLKVNRKKSRTCKPHELNFLGHKILKDGNLGLSRKSEKRLKDKVREKTKRNRGISIHQMVRELNQVLRGWLNYFRKAKMQKRLEELDGWIRRRLRCFRLKQCKRAKGIIRFLTNLGISKLESVKLAVSHKGWYRKSYNPAAHIAMNINWFRKIKLYSLADNYRYRI